MRADSFCVSNLHFRIDKFRKKSQYDKKMHRLESSFYGRTDPDWKR